MMHTQYEYVFAQNSAMKTSVPAGADGSPIISPLSVMENILQRAHRNIMPGWRRPGKKTHNYGEINGLAAK